VTSSTLEPRFLSGEFDVALSYQNTTSERREFPGAERVDLLRDSFLIGLPPGRRLARGKGPVSLAALAQEDWIVASREGFLVQACRDAGFEPRVVATTTDPMAARGMIARGLGVGWVPSLLIDEYGGIVIRPVKDPIRQREIFALLPPGDRHPLARPVINALLETAAGFRAPA
jgi:DNA-binding transcriptional LysR family regulator